MDATTPPNTQDLATQIQALKRRQRQRFSFGVNLSYTVLMLFLIAAFSGIEIKIGSITLFKAISLDWEFIRQQWSFIATGVWLT
ncbi:MAG: hypothetical protein D6835_02230, partial [Candidatus Thermofonsia bacterium]